MSRLKQRCLFSTIQHLINHLMLLVAPIAVSVQHITGQPSCRMRRAERGSRFHANTAQPKRNLRYLYVPTSRIHSCPTPPPHSHWLPKLRHNSFLVTRRRPGYREGAPPMIRQLYEALVCSIIRPPRANYSLRSRAIADVAHLTPVTPKKDTSERLVGSLV